MDIEIQNRKREALLKNGKYQYTFKPIASDEKIKIFHMGCAGDTRVSRIQLEQGTEATSFIAPEKKVNSLSGIFKQLRDLDIQMRDEKSDFWGKVKLNNTGAILDFYNENIKSQLTALAGTVNVAVSVLNNDVLKKADVTVNANGVTIGSGKTIDGRTIASIMKVQPDSIDLISPLIKVRGDMIVDGSVTTKHLAASSVTAGKLAAGAVQAQHISTVGFETKFAQIGQATIQKFLSTSAFIGELFSKDAFIQKLNAVKIKATQLDVDWLNSYTGLIGGFRIGKNPNDGGFWLTGSNNFDCGINPGFNSGTRGAQLWAAWGQNWTNPGPKAWWVNASGEMHCNGKSYFGDDATFTSNTTFYYRPEMRQGLLVKGNIQVTGNIYYNNGGDSSGYWMYSTHFKSINPSSGYIYFNYSGGGSDWIPRNKEISDRRYKTDIKPSKVNGLKAINKLKTYSYTKEYDGEVESIECGIMAQDVKKYTKNAFQKAPDDVYTYNTFKLVPYMIKAIQELSDEVRILKRETEILKNAR